MSRVHPFPAGFAVALVAAVGLGACGRGHDPAPPAAGSAAAPRPWSPDTVATVGGEPITEADVGLVREGGHGGAGATSEAMAVDDIVREQLAADRARALGLDDDPAYQAELHRRLAPIKAFERQRLSELYYRSLDADAKVDPAAVRAYFDQHETEIRTEIRVWQILDRDRAAIDQAAAQLAAGTTFEAVAGAKFPHLPTGRPPWDVGYLRWNQVPAAWKPALAGMKPGDVSGVIAGPRDRFWIIELVDRRQDPATTFETVRPVIEGLLRAERAQAARDAADQDLRAHARVVRRGRPAAGGAPTPVGGGPVEP
jgi:peptidyl-prolyl cis-trans isomerase C